jgi:hypothetical protein
VLFSNSNWSEEFRQVSIPLRDATFEANRRLSADESDEILGGTPAPAGEPVHTLNTRGLTEGQAALGVEAKRIAAERGISHADAVEVALREGFGHSSATVNLRALPGETFAQFTTRVARERALDLHAAHRLCAEAAPKLAEAWANGTAL